MSALWPLQVALVTRWKADAGVAALVGDRVFRGLAPAGTPLPYVRVGSKTEAGRPLLDRTGWMDTITADAFSAGYDDEEALAIVAAMNASLRGNPVDVEGFGSVNLRPEFTTVLEEEDGKVRHAPVRYRAYAVAAL